MAVHANSTPAPLSHPPSDLGAFLVRPVDPGLLWRSTMARQPAYDYPAFFGVVDEDILRSRAGIEAEVERLIDVLDAIDAASEDLEDANDAEATNEDGDGHEDIEDEDAIMFGGAGA